MAVVVLRDTFDFMLGAENDGHALVQRDRLEVHDAFTPGGGGTTCRLYCSSIKNRVSVMRFMVAFLEQG